MIQFIKQLSGLDFRNLDYVVIMIELYYVEFKVIYY